MNLYSNSGKNAQATEDREAEAAYSKLPRADGSGPDGPDGPESYELTEQDLSGDEDAVKIGGEDEVDWIGRERRVRL